MRVHGSPWEVTSKLEGTITAPLPRLNTWQAEKVALMSYGLMKAEGSQQQKGARQRRGREKVASGTRRIGRFLAKECFPGEAFWQEWVSWVVQLDWRYLFRVTCQTTLVTQATE